MIRHLALALMTLGLVDDAPPVDLPLPSAAEVAGPSEVRVRFDRDLDASTRETIVKAVKDGSIPYFALDGKGEPLGRLRIAASRFDDARTLALATDPHPRRAIYRLKLGSAPRDATVSYGLAGVEAKWFASADATEPSLTFVTPRLAITPTDESATLGHKGHPARLEMLTSASVPPKAKALVLEGNMPFESAVDNLLSEAEATGNGRYRLEIPLEGGAATAPIEIFAGLQTAKTGVKSEFSTFWKLVENEVPVAATDLTLPWLPGERAEAAVPDPPFALAGGDPVKGEAIFRSESAKCASCHAIGGKGGAVGPALDGLNGRDPREVYQSIAEPSARIAPEYRTFTVSRKDGQVAVGVMKTENFDAIRIMDINGQATIVPRKEIDEMQPSDTSTMPVGLAGAIGESGMRDLLAYLLK